MLLRPVALGAHLFGLFCVSIAVGLGVWQLGTWEGHRDDASAEAVDRPAEPLTDLMGPDEPFQKNDVGRPTLVTGEWLSESTVYVAERERDGVEGYWVITVMAVDGTTSSVPVVRGWAESIEPRPEVPSGPATVTGWLQPPEGIAGLVDDDPSDDVLPQVRMADLVQHVDRDLYGAYVLLDHDAEQSNADAQALAAVDLEQVPDVAATTGWRNFLYAVEWWIFAGFALFIWVRWCRDEVLRERRGPEDDDAERGDTEGDTSDVLAEA